MKTDLIVHSTIIIISMNIIHCYVVIEQLDSLTKSLSDIKPLHTTLVFTYSNTQKNSDIIMDILYNEILHWKPMKLIEMTDQVPNERDFESSELVILYSSMLLLSYKDYIGGSQEQIYHIISCMKVYSMQTPDDYFLIMLKTLDTFDEEIEDILKFAWSEDILNIIILEIQHDINNLYESSHNYYSFMNTEHLYTMKVHQYDPFLKKFYHKPFTPGISLFPDFAKDMHGFPLSIYPLQQVPFGIVAWNKDASVRAKIGASYRLIEYLAKELNFTPIIEKSLYSRSDVSINTTGPATIALLQKLGHFVVAGIAPHQTEDIAEEVLRLRPIIPIDLGILMPIDYYINEQKIQDAIGSGILTLIITTIVWLVAVLMRVERKIWNLYFILRLLFSIPVRDQPRRPSQRVLFFLVVMIGFTFSKEIYSSLANIGVDSIKENDYNTIEEIKDSGCTPMILSVLFTRTFAHATEVELHLKENIVPTYKINECIDAAINYRNTCCLVSSLEGAFYRMKSQVIQGEYKLTFAKPIFWSDHGTFNIGKHAFYKRHMNRVISHLSEAGIIKRSYTHFSELLTGVIRKREKGKEIVGDSHALLSQIYAIEILGWAIAIIVFLGELFSYHCQYRVDRIFVVCKRNWKNSRFK
uniref:Ionotropic glutamate receptor L-glutamate and glycine-binding domain-containing protein n=1 Tax=Bracon brevicornis TaxID=1563983 RepID=A0A6V7K048_9HYME